METLGFELYLFFDYVSESGGEKYKYLACLNDSEPWVDVLAKWINGWKSVEEN